ncbi:hypothetical protein GGI15_003180 [Coemansia interrupta]|uniref:Rad21/Rec8-like protein C-terminal eukaryotic domain-containing protein n=1 Tax=Coemansia interrupta TaxID=1126814 RepID=A0A9W8HE24_9FUNG|nr:hypothetical protein GGI15_003180 [Coemansia interrupta]
MSLRLSSILLVGLARVLKRQADMLNSDYFYNVDPDGFADATAERHALFGCRNALTADAQLVRPDVYGDSDRYENSNVHGNGHIHLFLELDDAANYGGDIHFSDDGNLHFIPSSPPPVADGGATVERLHANFETDGSGLSTVEGAQAVPLAGRLSFGMVGNAAEISAAEAQHNAPEIPAITTYDQRLEAVENDLIGHWPERLNRTLELAAYGPDVSELQHASKRQRVSRIQRRLETFVSDGRTYEDDVRALWGSTCVWDALSEANAAALGRQARQHIRNRVKRSSDMYANACVPSIAKLFDLVMPWSVPEAVGERVPGADDNAVNRDGDDEEGIGRYILDDDLDLELEERRGEAPGAAERELDHLDLHLDIPWLNPDMLNLAQRSQSAAGRSVSIRTESSPDPARHARQHSASVLGTPNSHVASLDPLSSEDGLEIRSFELTAPGADADHNMDASMVSLQGLDSFLDISRLGANGAHQTTVAIEMDRESRSFRQFVLARFEEHRSGTIAFERLLLPSYNNRRVAARAFVDLLQLASKSVFGVYQKEPYSTVYISSA